MPAGGKIIHTLQRLAEEGGTSVSFEFFPAKTADGVNNLLKRVEDMSAALRPSFVSLTWRSAFRDEELWLKIGATVQREFGVDVLLHLTCHLPREDLRRVLRRAREAGLRNVLALRGDPPMGHERWAPPRPDHDGFSNAIELVRLIREEHGDYFCIAVAGYPEVHTECWNSPDLPPSQQARALDLQRLKEKVDAGADFIITQFFYDVDSYLQFVAQCHDAGINVPIIPGYLPIQMYKTFKKFTTWCRTFVPDRLSDALEKVKEDDEEVRELGVREATAACRRLLREGPGPFRCLHFYTMNLAGAVSAILENLDLTPKAHLRALSWMRHGTESTMTTGGAVTTTAASAAVAAATTGRADSAGSPHSTTDAAATTEAEVRPIFWANRQSSYAMRTTGWEEYPNGRWGDARSPAYGELSHYYLEFKRPKVNRRKLWGEPCREEDVFRVFQRFIDGDINTLPWCDLPPARETNLISTNLRLLNDNGYLTINSQPCVCGVPSTDPDVGWGGPGGYVYQKAYVEFFCSPAKLQLLLEQFDNFPSLTYHAMNVNGESVGNCGQAVNAVTWGVFPGREVLQPTVVDPASFEAWKDEAFELWVTQWAPAYDEDSESRRVIQHIRDTYFLVNVVDNNFSGSGSGSGSGNGSGVTDGSSGIFAIFKRVITDHMTADEMRQRIAELEAENEALHGSMNKLKQLQQSTAADMTALADDLAASRASEDKLRAELHELRFAHALQRPAAANA